MLPYDDIQQYTSIRQDTSIIARKTCTAYEQEKLVAYEHRSKKNLHSCLQGEKLRRVIAHLLFKEKNKTSVWTEYQ
jgi:hypothetical protein